MRQFLPTKTKKPPEEKEDKLNLERLPFEYLGFRRLPLWKRSFHPPIVATGVSRMFETLFKNNMASKKMPVKMEMTVPIARMCVLG